MRRKLVLTVALAIAISFVLSPLMRADAVVVLSNRPWSDVGGICIGENGTWYTSVRFTVPTADSYILNSVTVNLHEVEGGATAQMTLHDDAFGTTERGNLIATLGTRTLGAPDSFLEYTFPGGGNLLGAGASYWISVTVPDAARCAAGFSDNGTPPTGIFTYSTTVAVQGYDPFVIDPVDIEIDADILHYVPNLGLVQINASTPAQPYGSPGLEMQNFLLPADFDSNGFDTYTVAAVAMVGDEYWLGLFIGGPDWVYVPYSAIIPLTPIAGID